MSDDYAKHCVRCGTQCDDYHVLTLTDNYQREGGYSRITSCKEAEATFCDACAQMITAVFWGQQ